MPEFDAQHRRLQRVQATVETDHRMHILGGLATMAHHADLLRYRTVVRYNSASITKGAQVLARIKAEAGRVAKRTNTLASITGAVRLTRILNDLEAMLLGNIRYVVHLSWMSVQVYGYDCLSSWRNGALYQVRIHVVTVRLNINQNRHGSSMYYR
jgi:hypothetical protein